MSISVELRCYSFTNNISPLVLIYCGVIPSVFLEYSMTYLCFRNLRKGCMVRFPQLLAYRLPYFITVKKMVVTVSGLQFSGKIALKGHGFAMFFFFTLTSNLSTVSVYVLQSCR